MIYPNDKKVGSFFAKSPLNKPFTYNGKQVCITTRWDMQDKCYDHIWQIDDEEFEFIHGSYFMFDDDELKYIKIIELLNL